MSSSDNEIRILKKIIEGLEMVNDSLVTGIQELNPLSTQLAKNIPDPKNRIKFFLVLNKIELLLERILYIEAESPYCKIVFDAEQVRVMEQRIPIQSLDQYFPDDKLLRIHRSYLVNPNAVMCVEKKNIPDYEIWIKDVNRNTTTLPVGRSYVTSLRKDYPQWF